MNRLISLPFSHYVEKARWALDRAGIDYVEERYMPVFSSVAVAIAVRGRGGATDRVSSRFSSPTLLLSDGTVLRSSHDIVRHADRIGGLGWYDDPEAAELERWYHDCLGPHTRRVAYSVLFSDPQVLRDLASANVSPRQARWFDRATPVLAPMIGRSLGVDEARSARSLDYARAELDKVAERLSDGRRYLLGDRFSAADLAFACMVTPGLAPTREEGFGAVLPALASLPPAGQDLLREFRAHPAGQFALRLFREDRRPR